MEGLQTPEFAVRPPSELLETFLRTRSSFDRVRDIQEELDRLSGSDEERRPSLWMILARLIISRYSDHYEALVVLQQIYQMFGAPEEMRPYTLYGGSSTDDALLPTDTIVANLDAHLKGHGAW